MLCVYSRMVKLNGVEKYIVKKGGSRYRWWGYVGGERGTGGGGSDENSGGSSTSQTNSKDGVGAFDGARFSVVSAAVLYGCSTFDTVFQLRNRPRRNNYRLFPPSGTQSFIYRAYKQKVFVHISQNRSNQCPSFLFVCEIDMKRFAMTMG